MVINIVHKNFYKLFLILGAIFYSLWGWVAVNFTTPNDPYVERLILSAFFIVVLGFNFIKPAWEEKTTLFCLFLLTTHFLSFTVRADQWGSVVFLNYYISLFFIMATISSVCRTYAHVIIYFMLNAILSFIGSYFVKINTTPELFIMSNCTFAFFLAVVSWLKVNLSVQLEKEKLKNLKNLKIRTIQEMTSSLFHEITNPLNAISLNNDYEILTNGSTAGREEISVALQKINKTLDIVKQLCKEAPRETFESINLAKVVRSKLADESIEQELKLDFPEEFFVMGSSELIYHLLDILISNAVKTSSRKGTIYISMVKEGNKNLFKIKNEAVPLEQDLVDSVFDPFVRDKDISQGMGLELSVAKQIVKNLKGELYYQTVNKLPEFVVEFIAPSP